ncbi:hypothetical protein FB192DRAFT_1348031 [Mucor lusitanicus]|uniref:Uncharacterized protein n=2 Tax=Mucor circinelloides f. lusitanicus TaxID=29924 RepID=A0A162Q1V2_MUCCL|nr:hypothetical protein FB192DRAFT_1348031 [Mucor lusitanicus]OAC98159.1 hypothetical protein MUCCIDRAFT_167804 [Mucor lusitanicus CBS 277.49]
MYISSLIKFIVEAYSFVCILLVTLLPTLYIAQSFLTTVEKQHNTETMLQKRLSDLEARIDQRLVEANDRKQHQCNTKQSRVEDLHERMEALEAQFEQETFVHKLILENKSLLLDIALQSQNTRMNCVERRLDSEEHNSRADQAHQMKYLSGAIQSISNTTKIFNDLLPRVLALEVSQSTPPQETTTPILNKFEQQIKGLSQKMHQIDETLNNCVPAKAHVEFLGMRQIVNDGSNFCAELKAYVDRVDARLMRLEQVITEAATHDYEEYTESDQIILY